MFYRDQADPVVERFVDERRELSRLIERLETARLQTETDKHLSSRQAATVLAEQYRQPAEYE